MLLTMMFELLDNRYHRRFASDGSSSGPSPESEVFLLLTRDFVVIHKAHVLF